MSEEIKSSLISTLSSGQIDALIQEEHLKKQGYQFYYCIDADVVRTFSFPLDLGGARPEEKKLDYEYITDEQIALYSLFGSASFRGFISKEHYENEFLQLINRLKYLVDSGKSAVDTVKSLNEKLIERTHKNPADLKGHIELIRQNISLILSIAVGLQGDGIEKLFKLKRERKIAFDEDAFSEWLEPRSENIFDKLDTYWDLTDFLHNFLLDNFGGRRENKGSQGMDLETMKRNISFLRDAAVMSKTLALNAYLDQRQAKKIVLYLSSDNKTQNVFYQKSLGLEGMLSPVAENSIEIDDEKVNYHRNTAQIFLRLLCEDDSNETVIDLLTMIRNSVSTREYWRKVSGVRMTAIVENEVLKVDRFLAQRIQQCRKEFAGFSTFAKINHFRNLALELNEKTIPASLSHIPGILLQIVNDLEQNGQSWREAAGTQLKELSQLVIFRNVIGGRLDGIIQNQVLQANIQELDAGKDYIYGSDHYVPTYFVGKDHHEPLFYSIIQHFYDPLEAFRPFIYTSAIQLFANPQYEDEMILKRCILLLMLSNSELQGQRLSEQQLENILSRYNFENSPYESDFYYLLTWVMRRNRNYTSAIEKATKAHEKFPQDPRFYHSLALTLYCQFQERAQNGDEDVDLLVDSLDTANFAIDGYERIDKDLDTDDPSYKYVRRNIYALYNTTIYIQALGFTVDKNIFSSDALLEARHSLAKLKRIDPLYSQKPEFLQTESFLEQQEYEDTKNIEKLRNSLAALEAALKLPKITARLKQLCLDHLDQIKRKLAQITPPS